MAGEPSRIAARREAGSAQPDQLERRTGRCGGFDTHTPRGCVAAQMAHGDIATIRMALS